MLHLHLLSLSMSALRRDTSPDAPVDEVASMPTASWALIFLITLLFIPAFVWSSYSVRHVYTTLAIVENPTPAAYEAVANDEHDEHDEHDATPASALGAVADAEAEAFAGTTLTGPAQPITASLRRIRHTLRAAYGWKGDFRGFRLAIVISVATAIGSSVLDAVPFLLPFVGSLCMSLALVQLNTAWVHAVLRAPSAEPSSASGSSLTALFRSLPPFRRVFEATCVPVLLTWVARFATGGIALLIANAVGLQAYDLRNPQDVPVYSHAMLWKLVLVGLVTLVLAVAVVLPANVLLVRVQASMFAPDADTVVPFDRSFGGALAPTVAGGRGFATLREAYASVSVASWKRIVLAYAKATAVSAAVTALYGLLILPIVAFTARSQ